MTATMQMDLSFMTPQDRDMRCEETNQLHNSLKNVPDKSVAMDFESSMNENMLRGNHFNKQDLVQTSDNTDCSSKGVKVMSVHAKPEADALFHCEKCNRLCSSWSQYQHHTAQHAHLVCNICNRIFVNKIALRRHEKKHKSSSLYRCSTCGKSFSAKSYLDNHEKIHLEVKPFTCDKCGKGFAQKPNLERHLRSAHVHAASGVGLCVCPMCGKEMYDKYALTQHLHTHNTHKNFTCKVCGKSFKARQNLRHHEKSHLSERPHQCAVCGAAFYQAAALTRHRRTHTPREERPFVCSVCSRAFSDASTLRNHVFVHSGKQKPYNCDVCGKAFIRKHRYNKHKLLHGGSSDKNATSFAQQNLQSSSDACVNVIESSSGLQNKLAFAYNINSLGTFISGESIMNFQLPNESIRILTEEEATVASSKTVNFQEYDTRKVSVDQHSCRNDLTKQSENISNVKHKLDETLPSQADYSRQPNFSDDHSWTSEGDADARLVQILRPSGNNNVFHGGVQNVSYPGRTIHITCDDSSTVVNNIDCRVESVRPAKSYLPQLPDPVKVSDEDVDAQLEKEDELGIPVIEIEDPESLIKTGRQNGMSLTSTEVNHDCESSTQVSVKKEKTFQCSLCDGVFRNSNALNSHMKRHPAVDMMRQQVSPAKSTECNKALKGVKHLIVHMRTHSNEKPYVCRFCGKGFAASAYLKAHEKIHKSDKKYQCDLCETSFAQKINRERHMRSRHGAASGPPPSGGGGDLTCQYCGRLCYDKYALKAHLVMHRTEKNFKCDECGKMFKGLQHLRHHERTHLRTRPHVCQQCGKSFYQTSALKRHERTHSGEKPFWCEICDRVFSDSSSLRNHKFTHTEEKPYACNVCSKSFIRLHRYKNHVLTHVTKSPVRCQNHITKNDSINVNKDIPSSEKCDQAAEAYTVGPVLLDLT